MLSLLHHIAVIVTDYQKSRDFYTNILGFEIIREQYREKQKDYKLDLKMGEIELEVFGKEGSPKRLTYPEACGLRHAAFLVEDIEEEIKRLKNRGVMVEEVRFDEATGKKMAFFYDPDGLPWELHE